MHCDTDQPLSLRVGAFERIEMVGTAYNGRVCAQVRELLLEAQPFLTMPSLATHTAMLMRDTRTSNALLCQPQQRNTAGRIFGGFLMRRAFVSTRTFQL